MIASALPANVVESIERAIKDDRVTALASVLVELASARAFDDATSFLSPVDGSYARRLLWRDPDQRFLITANTWAPGQGTPLHDHAGFWGAEVVVRGTMRECSYRMIERDANGSARFTHEGDTLLAERSVGILVPPLEYHSYHNACETVAHTVHVYAGMLDRCMAYKPAADDWWRGEERALGFDD